MALATLTPDAQNRYYSGPPRPNAVGMSYIWSETSVINDTHGQPSTGNWVPQQELTAIATNNYSPSGTIGTSGTFLTGQLFGTNLSRAQLYIQNIGSGSALYVKLGAAPASQQSFSLLLAAATSDWGSNGGIFSDNGVYKGPVSVSGSTRAIFWEA